MFMETQGSDPDKTPMMIAPHPSTKPEVVKGKNLSAPRFSRKKNLGAERRTGSGSDRDKARNDALHGSDDRGPLEVNSVADGPNEKTRRGANVGVKHGDSGIGPSVEGVSSIESWKMTRSAELTGTRIFGDRTGPAHPEDTSSGHRHEDVVGLEVGAVGGETRTDPVRADEASRSGRQVDNVSSRVWPAGCEFLFTEMKKKEKKWLTVHQSALEEEASTPNRERSDRVAAGEPQRHENDPRQEVHLW